MKSIFLSIIVFSLLSLVQVSFVPHVSLWGWVPNLVLIALLVFSAFASLPSGIGASLAGGFFLDVYSSLPFGFWMVLFLIFSLGARYIFQHYVRLPQYL